MIEQYLQEIINQKRLPGLSIAYIDDKDYFYNYGYLDYTHNQKVTSNTLYDMASLTKVVSTTTLILKLIEEGYFTLYTKVKDILNEFKHDDVTIFNLLTHTSGLPADNKDYKNCNSKDELYDFTFRQELFYKPFEKVEYSDFGFIILGKIIEKYKGSIEQYANEIIFKPLGMNNTMYNPYLKNRANDCAPCEVTKQRGEIKGIVHDGKAYILEGLSGNAGLFSCCSDLVKFVHMILNNDGSILKKQSIDLFKTNFTSGLNLSRTIGWFYNDETTPVYNLSKTSIFHTGFAGGSIFIDLENKRSVIILTNRVHPTRDNDISDIRLNIHKMLLSGE